jgi:putative MATE family efflux protein
VSGDDPDPRDEADGPTASGAADDDRDEPTGALDRLRARVGGLFRSEDELELTSGGIAWPLFFLSLPIVITNVLQTAYNIADTFWLGQYSTNALAAISFSFPLVFLLIALGMGLSVAGSVLVAQHTGAGDERGAAYAASQTVGYTFAFSTVLGVVGYFLVGDVLALFGAEPRTLELATGYMQVISLGLPLMFGFFVFVSLMRGAGDTVTPMLVMFGTVALNVVVDPVLIFGWGPAPRLGMTGAAVATIGSRGLATAAGVAIMLKGDRGVAITPRDMVPNPSYGRKLVEIGVPASIEGTGRALSVNAMLLIIGGFSTTIVAAYGIGTRVFSVIFLPAIAVAQGVETMTGQNIGADRVDRARRTNRFAAKTMFFVLTALGAVIFLIAEPIAAVFTDDPGVIAESARFIRYVTLTFGFIGIMRTFTGGFRGVGQTMVAAAISILMLAAIRLPIAWVAAGAYGPPGVWASFAVSNVAGAVIAYAWFRLGSWEGEDARGEEAPGVPADD